MLTVTALRRVFIFKNGTQEIRLEDPEPSMTAESVRDFYALTYPLLTTATVELPVIENDEEVYYLNGKLGVKG
jgi:PRTRC genetic system protein C